MGAGGVLLPQTLGGRAPRRSCWRVAALLLRLWYFPSYRPTGGWRLMMIRFAEWTAYIRGRKRLCS